MQTIDLGAYSANSPGLYPNTPPSMSSSYTPLGSMYSSETSYSPYGSVPTASPALSNPMTPMNPISPAVNPPTPGMPSVELDRGEHSARIIYVR